MFDLDVLNLDASELRVLTSSPERMALAIKLAKIMGARWPIGDPGEWLHARNAGETFEGRRPVELLIAGNAREQLELKRFVQYWVLNGW